MSCINTDSVEFQTNLKKSGLSEFDYTVQVMMYFNKQRAMGIPEDKLKYPELDMVAGSDSSAYLADHIKLKDDGAAIIDILQYAKTSDVAQATIEINNKHRDLEVNILPLNEQALVQIEKRPTTLEDKMSPKHEVYRDRSVLGNLFYKLATLYGIKFNDVTIAELNSDEKFKQVTDAKHTNAFILDGEIYINTDVAKADAPIHEMSHMLLGSIKYQNPSLYYDIVSISEKLPAYDELIKNYPGRTRSDINEEIFVTELAKFASNQRSIIQELPEFVQYEILYNIKRMLDSILMGDVSVKIVPTEKLLSMSLFDIAELVNSESFTNYSRGTLNDSHIHRILNNRKSDLMNNNELKEICE